MRAERNGEGMRMNPEDASAQARVERQHDGDGEYGMRLMTAMETRGKKDRGTANKLWL